MHEPTRQSKDPKRFSESKLKNISIDDIYLSYDGSTEQAVRDFMSTKGDIHCVACKSILELATDPIVYPVNNKLSLSLRKSDGTIEHGVPYFTCPDCNYNNSFLKLLQQAVKVTDAKRKEIMERFALPKITKIE